MKVTEAKCDKTVKDKLRQELETETAKGKTEVETMRLDYGTQTQEKGEA